MQQDVASRLTGHPLALRDSCCASDEDELHASGRSGRVSKDRVAASPSQAVTAHDSMDCDDLASPRDQPDLCLRRTAQVDSSPVLWKTQPEAEAPGAVPSRW